MVDRCLLILTFNSWGLLHLIHFINFIYVYQYRNFPPPCFFPNFSASSEGETPVSFHLLWPSFHVVPSRPLRRLGKELGLSPRSEDERPKARTNAEGNAESGEEWWKCVVLMGRCWLAIISFWGGEGGEGSEGGEVLKLIMRWFWFPYDFIGLGDVMIQILVDLPKCKILPPESPRSAFGGVLLGLYFYTLLEALGSYMFEVKQIMNHLTNCCWFCFRRDPVYILQPCSEMAQRFLGKSAAIQECNEIGRGVFGWIQHIYTYINLLFRSYVKHGMKLCGIWDFSSISLSLSLIHGTLMTLISLDKHIVFESLTWRTLMGCMYVTVTVTICNHNHLGLIIYANISMAFSWQKRRIKQIFVLQIARLDYQRVDVWTEKLNMHLVMFGISTFSKHCLCVAY